MIPSFFYVGRGGQMYFKDTFVPVDFLWQYLEEGYAVVAFLEGFPNVSRNNVIAAIRIARLTLLERYVSGEPTF